MGSDYQLGTFFGGTAQRGASTIASRRHVDYSAREPLTERRARQFRELPPDSSPRARALGRKLARPMRPSGRADRRARDGVSALAAVLSTR